MPLLVVIIPNDPSTRSDNVSSMWSTFETFLIYIYTQTLRDSLSRIKHLRVLWITTILILYNKAKTFLERILFSVGRDALLSDQSPSWWHENFCLLERYVPLIPCKPLTCLVVWFARGTVTLLLLVVKKYFDYNTFLWPKSAQLKPVMINFPLSFVFCPDFTLYCHEDDIIYDLFTYTGLCTFWKKISFQKIGGKVQRLLSFVNYLYRNRHHLNKIRSFPSFDSLRCLARRKIEAEMSDIFQHVWVT